MKYLGIDLHKRIIVVCVMNGKREVLERKKFLNSEVDEMKEFFKGLGKFEAVFEATASYEWFYQLLEPFAERIVLAHPKKLRIIAESTQKTDKVDAFILAQFLVLDMLPPAHRPSPYIQGYRSLVRCRHKIQSNITSVKNQIRHVLAKYNQDMKNIFTKQGRMGLKKLKIREADRYVINVKIEELELFEKQLKQTDKEIRAYVKKAPRKIQEGVEIIKTAPGIGVVTADVFMSELGDIDRFGSQKKVAAYVGLDPGYRQSGDKEKGLGISKEGPKLLRCCMIEAAWSATQHSAKWKRVYQELLRKTGQPKKAIVGVARRLLCVLVSMLKNGSAYIPHIPNPQKGELIKSA
jgi:transposase